MSDDTATVDIRPTNVDPTADPPIDVGDVTFATERYEVLSVLGKGGMGEVRLCRDARISRQVAVKVLQSRLAQKPDYRSRFLLEARLQGQLEHPAIVPVHDIGTLPDGDLYFTMKRVRGVTLRHALRTVKNGEGGERFTRRRLLTAYSSVCLAIDFAHRRGVVHRDLKPENVMLGDFGEVYILDWGIAKVVHRADTEPGELELDVGDTEHSRLGSVLGTPHYMAPEFRTGAADPRSDVYALGVILQEICEGGELPPELAAIIGAAIAPDPEHRTASARDIHDALERYLDGDRDLATRKQLAEQHADHAEQMFGRSPGDPGVRQLAARDIGRALGLDPNNTRALRLLMRMLADVPAELPPEAQAEINRRWRLRRARMFRIGILSILATGMLALYMLGMGVLDGRLLGGFAACTLAAAGCQALVGKTAHDGVAIAIAVLFKMLGFALLSRSMGLLGVLPAALAVVTFAHRINFDRASQGLALVASALVALFAPLVLEWTGVIEPTYAIRDGVITILPRMHAFPPLATTVFIALATSAAMLVGVLYARGYVRELVRAERQLTFQTWQLQQLVPPEPLQHAAAAEPLDRVA